MVAGKQKPIRKPQAAVTLGMSGRRDGKEAGSQLDWAFTIEYDLGIGLRLQFQAVNDPPRREVLCVLGRIRDVVLMRQEDMADSAQALQPPNQCRDELRRIDQPVALRVPNEVA